MEPQVLSQLLTNMNRGHTAVIYVTRIVLHSMRRFAVLEIIVYIFPWPRQKCREENGHVVHFYTGTQKPGVEAGLRHGMESGCVSASFLPPALAVGSVKDSRLWKPELHKYRALLSALSCPGL